MNWWFFLIDGKDECGDPQASTDIHESWWGNNNIRNPWLNSDHSIQKQYPQLDNQNYLDLAWVMLKNECSSSWGRGFFFRYLSWLYLLFALSKSFWASARFFRASLILWAISSPFTLVWDRTSLDWLPGCCHSSWDLCLRCVHLTARFIEFWYILQLNKGKSFPIHYKTTNLLILVSPVAFSDSCWLWRSLASGSVGHPN